MSNTTTDKPVDADALAECIRNSTAARGVDLYAVEHLGYSPAEWGDKTDRNRRTVRRNVDRANGNE